jgi:hypothetical protein
LLTEILKASDAPIAALLSVLREQNSDLDWDVIGLPAGKLAPSFFHPPQSSHSFQNLEIHSRGILYTISEA